MVAVLVGLVLLPCTDGMMTTDGRQADGATSAMVVDAAFHGGTAMAADTGMPNPRDLGGLLAACVVFLVLAAALGLRPARLRTVVGVLTRADAPVRRVVGARAPSLAQLCLLRT